MENVARFNGVNEQQVTVSPATGATTLAFDTCATVPSCIPSGSLTKSAITYSQAPNLRTPYTMQTGGSIEHQIIKPLTVTLTYLNSRGNHQFFSQNTAFNAGAAANAPSVYQYVSEGVFKQNQLIVQGTYRGPGGISLFGFYTFSHAHADTSGSGTFPSVSGLDGANNITADYGRAGFDVHQRLFLGGSVPLPYNIALSPFMIVNSGQPFNITLGEDLNKDGILNDRPAFANCNGTGTATQAPVSSKYGCFDKNTQLGQTPIPINDAQGPAQVAFNLRVTKTFGFGAMKNRPTTQQGGPSQGGPPPGAGGGHHEHSGGGPGMGFGGGTNTGRKYNLTIGAQALNLFNVVNYAAPVGVLSSPQFAQQTRLAGNIFSTSTAVRRIALQANFTF